MTDHLHIKPGSEAVGCEIHDWPMERKIREFVPLLRARHGKGGLNVCVDCIEAMKEEAGKRVGAPPR